MIKIIIVSVILVVFGSGCTTLKYQSAPPVSSDTQFVVGKSTLLSTLDSLNDSGDILYFQNFGGGGVGVGLLLGPIGVAANAAAIKSNTKKDVDLLSGKIDLSPVDLFENAARTSSFDLKEDLPQAAAITPYVYITKVGDEKLLFASAMIVETSPGEKESWIGKYMYQTDFEVNKDAIGGGLSKEIEDELRMEILAGFNYLLSLFVQDAQGVLLIENSVKFKSNFVSPRFDFQMLGDTLATQSERVDIRTVGAIYSLPKVSVEVVVKK